MATSDPWVTPAASAPCGPQDPQQGRRSPLDRSTLPPWTCRSPTTSAARALLGQMIDSADVGHPDRGTGLAFTKPPPDEVIIALMLCDHLRVGESSSPRAGRRSALGSQGRPCSTSGCCPGLRRIGVQWPVTSRSARRRQTEAVECVGGGRRRVPGHRPQAAGLRGSSPPPTFQIGERPDTGPGYTLEWVHDEQ